MEYLNGWTKEKVIEKINTEFKGRCVGIDELETCLYLNDEGKKCVVGLFIPDGHLGQRYIGCALSLLYHHRDLKKVMPFSDCFMSAWQRIHDAESFNNLSLDEQKQKLIAFLED